MSQGRCGRCLSPPSCPFRHHDTVRSARLLTILNTQLVRHIHYVEMNVIPAFFQEKTERCFNYRSRYGPSYSRWYGDLDDHFSRIGCKRVCQFPSWVQKCCKNHYGRDCQGKEGRNEKRKILCFPEALVFRNLRRVQKVALEKR